MARAGHTVGWRWVTIFWLALGHTFGGRWVTLWRALGHNFGRRWAGLLVCLACIMLAVWVRA